MQSFLHLGVFVVDGWLVRLVIFPLSLNFPAFFFWRCLFLNFAEVPRGALNLEAASVCAGPFSP